MLRIAAAAMPHSPDCTETCTPHAHSPIIVFVRGLRIHTFVRGSHEARLRLFQGSGAAQHQQSQCMVISRLRMQFSFCCVATRHEQTRVTDNSARRLHSVSLYRWSRLRILFGAVGSHRAFLRSRRTGALPAPPPLPPPPLLQQRPSLK